MYIFLFKHIFHKHNHFDNFHLSRHFHKLASFCHLRNSHQSGELTPDKTVLTTLIITIPYLKNSFTVHVQLSYQNIILLVQDKMLMAAFELL